MSRKIQRLVVVQSSTFKNSRLSWLAGQLFSSAGAEYQRVFPPPFFAQNRTPKGLSPFGAAAGSVLQGRLERHLGIQAGGVALIAGAGGEGVVGTNRPARAGVGQAEARRAR